MKNNDIEEKEVPVNVFNQALKSMQKPKDKLMKDKGISSKDLEKKKEELLTKQKEIEEALRTIKDVERLFEEKDKST